MIKPSKYYQYKGCIHIHTNDSDGTKTLEEIAAIGNSVELDFLLFSDHMTLKSRDAGKEGFYNKTLVLIGYEHNDIEDCNHYLLFDSENVLPADMKPNDYVAEGKRQGALGIIAHPDEIRPRLGKYPSYPWLAWGAQGFDGIEIWNQMSEWMENLKPYNKIKMVFSPRRFMRSPTDRILQKWDELNRESKVAGLGAIDVHGYPYRIGPLRITIFPYKVQFKSLRTHIILTEKLSGDLPVAKNQVYNAIRDCRLFISNYRWGDAGGFSFLGWQEDKMVTCGGRLDTYKNSLLVAESPGRGNIKLIGNGKILVESAGTKMEYEPQENGIYRVEVHRGDRGWIYSNHIRIGI
jgi:hypothetical protein